jgi:hypothetical protein
VPDTQTDAAGATMKRRRVDWETVIAGAVFLAVSGVLIYIKVMRLDQQFGDTAQFYEIIENIAFHGTANDQLYPGLLQFITSGIGAQHAAQMAANPLLVPAAPDGSIFAFHAYWILYPLAALVRIIPSNIVLQSAYIFSFTTPLVMAYFALRRLTIPIAGALAFCVILTCHPAWSYGMQGQFFPDRLFLLAGFLLMLCASFGSRTGVLLLAAVFCWSINERGAITGGLFLVAFAALYWRRSRYDRMLYAGLGIVLIAYGYAMTKYFLPANSYNGGFLPTTFVELGIRFGDPTFRNNAIVFVLVNAALLVLSLFEWRAALIAVFLMLPNLVGNVGGAEKTGWTTHYHDEYLPALFWAALLGYRNLWQWAASERRRGLLYAGIGAVFVVMITLNPSTATLGTENIDTSFWPRLASDASQAFGPGGRAYLDEARAARAAVPEHTLVTTLEGAMPMLFRNRRLELFPIGLDQADYAVIGRSGTGAASVYSGVVNFNGPEETAKANALIVERMRRDGYDFDHPVFATPGVVIVKRMH